MKADRYTRWLDLPPGPRPPDSYSLLGLPRFERDPQRIAAAAAERVMRLREQATPQQAAEFRQLLDEVQAAAESLLSHPKRRELRRGVRANVTDAVETGPVQREGRRTRRFVAIGIACVVPLLLTAYAFSRMGSDAAERPAPQLRRTASVAVVPGSPAAGVKAPSVPPPVIALTPVVAVKPTAAPLAGNGEALARGGAIRPPVEAVRPLVGAAAEPYPLPEFESPEAQEEFAAELRELLYEGFQARGDLGKVREHHRAALALATGAPIADYALAIVLWRRLSLDEAEQHIRSARGEEGLSFPQADRALVLLLLSRERREDALQEAVAIAEKIGSSKQPAADRAGTTLHWLGRLTAFLEEPWRTEAIPPQDVIDADAAIRAALPAERLPEYEQGRRTLRDDYAARAEEIDATIAAISDEHDNRQAEELAKIAGERDAAADKRDKAGRTADQWKDWLDQQTREIDPQLEQLIPRFQQLAVEAEAAWASFVALNEQITLLLAREDRPRLAPGDSGSLVVLREQTLARFKVLSAQAAQVRRQAEILMAKRRAAVTRFERETKTLAATSDALKRWEGVLKRREKKTETAEADETPAVRSLRRRLREINTYLPLDLETERDAVLQSLR